MAAAEMPIHVGPSHRALRREDADGLGPADDHQGRSGVGARDSQVVQRPEDLRWGQADEELSVPSRSSPREEHGEGVAVEGPAGHVADGARRAGPAGSVAGAPRACADLPSGGGGGDHVVGRGDPGDDGSAAENPLSKGAVPGDAAPR